MADDRIAEIDGPPRLAEHDPSLCQTLHPGKTHDQSTTDTVAALARRDGNATVTEGQGDDREPACDNCGHELGGGRRCRSVGMCGCGFNHTRPES